ncbi:dynein regulatory complex protein 1 [Dunckerocampus dactyliophorus]|uniref:dynein regulatory complex protein 1 n=1 Tax=Dunckerocampus dactyliophorus TaxID=161453 RepID=UPI0024059D29|nr:dynein regulatory complex protein 1 [Dunckerocampus dactyliophorus]XP_054617994.1 dynein regulatory complex protein 1 [Dunckerocampus dactyliophorus]
METSQEARGHLGFSASKEAENSVSKQEDTSVEVNKERLPQGEEQDGGRISKLERDLLELVINIQTAADAKESMRRAELEEARRIRSEMLQNKAKSSQEKFEEITSRWSLAEQTVIPQELQETLTWQRLLCAELIEDKKKVIKDLQQELKCGDDRYVKDLRRQAEEMDVMMKHSEELISTLTQAYREELAHIESVYQQEHDVLLTKERTEWERCVKELWDKQQARLMERRAAVEEYEAKIHNLMMNPEQKYDAMRAECDAKFQYLEREHQQMLADSMISNINHMKRKADREMYSLAPMRNRITSLQTELRNLRSKYTRQQKQSEKQSRRLSDDYKRSIEQYERMQMRIKHFAVADAKQFEETWRMLDKEVRQQAEKAVLIDSLIWKHHLGVAWERPHGASSVDPVHPQKQVSMEHGATKQNVTSDGMDAASEKDKISVETLKELMELLCDELGFLVEDKVQLLSTLDKEEQNVVKLDALLYAFGIEKEDMPKLAAFLLNDQQRESYNDISRGSVESSAKTQGGATSSSSNKTFDLIQPNHILPALKNFLKHHRRFRRSSTSEQPRYWSADMWDSSADKAHWESLANIIPEDKLRVWDAAEIILKKHLAVLTEISDCMPEIEGLEQQNAELRMLLQQNNS